VLGALVFGISGYALHKVWVGMGLGIVLAGWAAVAVFTLCTEPLGFALPVVPAGTSLEQQAVDLWNALSADARKLLPFACSAALLSGVAISVLWPRVGVVLLYCSAGMSLLLGLGAAVVKSAKREWLAVIPSQTSSQVIVLVSLVAFGAILQWRVAPGTAPVRRQH
jgi:hypothetical protein